MSRDTDETARDWESMDRLAEDLLRLPEHSAVRFSVDDVSASYPLWRFKALAKFWLMRQDIIDGIDSLDYDQTWEDAENLVKRIAEIEDGDL